MTKFYRRRRPSLAETLMSAAVAAGVAGVTFYFTRMLVSREPLGQREPPGERTPLDRDQPASHGPGRRPGPP